MSENRRSEIARKGWETRRRRDQASFEEWQERGRYEDSMQWHLQSLKRHANVVIAEQSGQALIRTADNGEPALELGELRVSLEQITFIPREGLHPASMSYAMHSIVSFLRRIPIGNWEGWRKGQDEHLSDCYSITIVRVITEEWTEAGLNYGEAPLLDVDLIKAVTR